MRAVQEILREAGLSVWTDEGLKPGTPSWQAAIEEAVAQAQALFLGYTAAGPPRLYCSPECGGKAASMRRVVEGGRMRRWSVQPAGVAPGLPPSAHASP